MNLLYIYIEFCNKKGAKSPYRGLDSIELNFGAKSKFRYQNGQLCQELRSHPLAEGFWGRNIYNVSTLTGDNGVGKTTIMHYIMHLLWQIYEGKIIATDRGILLLQYQGEQIVIVLRGIGDEKFDVLCNDLNMIKIPLDYCENYHNDKLSTLINKSKIIYVTNTLNSNDYSHVEESNDNMFSMRQNQSKSVWYHMRYQFIYNCSICGRMLSDYMNNFEMEEKQPIKSLAMTDLLNDFFQYEFYKQIKYVFDKRQNAILKDLKKEETLVPVPQTLFISLQKIWIGPYEEKEDEHSGQSDRWEKAMFPNDYAEILEWKKKLQAGSIDETQFFKKLLSYELCYSCTVSFFQSILHEILKNKNGELRACDENEDFKRDKVIKSLCKAVESRRKEGENSVVVSNDFLYFINSIMDILEESFREYSFKIIHYTKRYYEEFIGEVQRIKDNIGDFFSITTSWNTYKNDNSKLEFTVTIEQAEWFCDFIQKYRYTCNPYYYMNFSWGLSSGESNLLNLLTSFYYIFDKDYTEERNGQYKIENMNVQGDKVSCDTVLVFIDEADLTFHPEWQRQFVKIITSFLPKIYSEECCKEIQIIMSTHSPLLLSDMPSENVIYLKRTNNNKNAVGQNAEIYTFGQNIHMLLKNSFFLEHGTIGEFASTKINEIIAGIREIEESLEGKRSDACNIMEMKEKVQKYKDAAGLLADGIIRGKLLERILQCEELLQDRESKLPYENMCDEELEEKICQMKRELNRRKENDKNHTHI